MTIVLLVVAAAIAIWALMAYNRLVGLRNQTRAAWADIDVQLTRRHDLVPQLVTIVRSYAGHERELLTSVTELRARAVTERSPAKLAQVEGELEKALGRLFAVVEAYPNLRATENYAQLQRDLNNIEEQLQYARRFYNGAVRDYNTALQRAPDVVIARSFGFMEAEFYQAGSEERAPVALNLP
jgi:LemA protein